MVFEVESVLLHYNLEEGSIMRSRYGHNAHHVSVCYDAVDFWGKASSYWEVLSHLN